MVRPPLEQWDTFACDVSGGHTFGVFISPTGIAAVITRNRLVVRDPARLVGGRTRVDATEFEVFSGCFEYGDLNIFLERGPKKGMMGVVWVEDPLAGMFFIACDGVRGGQYVGVERTDMEFLRLLLARGEEVGCVRAELAFLPSTDPMRFNQGDAAFAQSRGLPVPCTPPGKAEVPMVFRLVQNWKPYLA